MESRFITDVSMTMNSQKVALVTGAARGIGLAVAKRFLAEDWRVALLDIEETLLREAVGGLADPVNTLALHCDVSDSTAVQAAIAKISERFGRLDALVNNAGIAAFTPLLETSDADWSRILQVNLPVHQGGRAFAASMAAARSSTSPRFRRCAPRRCARPMARAKQTSRT